MNHLTAEIAFLRDLEQRLYRIPGTESEVESIIRRYRDLEREVREFERASRAMTPTSDETGDPFELIWEEAA